jgi:hypothetical protein
MCCRKGAALSVEAYCRSAPEQTPGRAPRTAASTPTSSGSSGAPPDKLQPVRRRLALLPLLALALAGCAETDDDTGADVARKLEARYAVDVVECWEGASPAWTHRWRCRLSSSRLDAGSGYRSNVWCAIGSPTETEEWEYELAYPSNLPNLVC